MENTDCKPLFGDSFLKDFVGKNGNKFDSNSNDIC